jgi:porphobilinogen synthase
MTKSVNLPGFPISRLRRLRKNETLREMISETALSPSDFMYPLFVTEGKNVKKAISSMPGIFQLSVENAIEECREAFELGIRSVILFGIPLHKDELGTGAYDEHGIIQKAIREIKQTLPQLIVATDVCLCEYTSHGHCGVVEGGLVNNDLTLELLVKEAITHAEAGADIIAPSDMMDGRVSAIRKGLDSKGFTDIPIIAYSAKYASAFYGPFREAAESSPKFGDRKSYQMDCRNSDESMREIYLDIKEGADMIMVKPALSYLDIIRRAKDNYNIPIAAYNVSGEYSMIRSAGNAGWIDGEKAMMEVLFSIKRAGADLIITYFAKDASKVLNRKK